MYTQEELLNALQEAGADGRPFTLSAVRARLGLQSGDKHELERFRRRVRSLQKASGGTLERVGNNSYRLKTSTDDVSGLTSAEIIPDRADAIAPAEVERAQLQLQAAMVAEPAPKAHAPVRIAPQPTAADLLEAAVPQPTPQPTAAGAVSARENLCARGLAMGQRVAQFVGTHYAQRHTHADRLRELARDWKPRAEALRAVGLMQLQALRQRVAAVRRPTA